MLTENQQKICDKYSARDAEGYVHCRECPLGLSEKLYGIACRATHHYDHHLHKWVLNEEYYDRMQIL